MDAVGILKISLLSPKWSFFIGEIIFRDTKKNIFNLMILLTNKCILYNQEKAWAFLSLNLKSLLHNFITSPEVSIGLYFIFFFNFSS